MINSEVLRKLSLIAYIASIVGLVGTAILAIMSMFGIVLLAPTLVIICGILITFLPAGLKDMKLTDMSTQRRYRWARRHNLQILREIADITLSEAPEWMRRTAYPVHWFLGFFYGLIGLAVLGMTLILDFIGIVDADAVVAADPFAFTFMFGMLLTTYYWSMAIHYVPFGNRH